MDKYYIASLIFAVIAVVLWIYVFKQNSSENYGLMLYIVGAAVTTILSLLTAIGRWIYNTFIFQIF